LLSHWKFGTKFYIGTLDDRKTIRKSRRHKSYLACCCKDKKQDGREDNIRKKELATQNGIKRKMSIREEKKQKLFVGRCHKRVDAVWIIHTMCTRRYIVLLYIYYIEAERERERESLYIPNKLY
jgi:hypothetical protein